MDLGAPMNNGVPNGAKTRRTGELTPRVSTPAPREYRDDL